MKIMILVAISAFSTVSCAKQTVAKLPVACLAIQETISIRGDIDRLLLSSIGDSSSLSLYISPISTLVTHSPLVLVTFDKGATLHNNTRWVILATYSPFLQEFPNEYRRLFDGLKTISARIVQCDQLEGFVPPALYGA